MSVDRKGSRVTPEVRAQREARVLALLRAGYRSDEAARLVGVSTTIVARIRAEHGVPKLPRGGSVAGRPRYDVTRMSHAELDAHAERVAADRAAGLLPPCT